MDAYRLAGIVVVVEVPGAEVLILVGRVQHREGVLMDTPPWNISFFFSRHKY